MPTTEPRLAQSICTTSDALVVCIGNEEFSIPWQSCSERLAKATSAERQQAKLSPGGYGIHWPAIDEDLSIEGLLSKSES